VADNLQLLPTAPTTTSPSSRAILLFGGAAGGIQEAALAADLARRGFAVLDLGYFAAPDEPRLPTAFGEHPDRVLRHRGRLLATQPEVDPAHISV
jgi:hypothetical protein